MPLLAENEEHVTVYILWQAQPEPRYQPRSSLARVTNAAFVVVAGDQLINRSLPEHVRSQVRRRYLDHALAISDGKLPQGMDPHPISILQNLLRSSTQYDRNGYEAIAFGLGVTMDQMSNVDTVGSSLLEADLDNGTGCHICG